MSKSVSLHSVLNCPSVSIISEPLKESLKLNWTICGQVEEAARVGLRLNDHRVYFFV